MLHRRVQEQKSIKSHMAAKVMTKCKALREKLEKRFEALSEAWLQNELFEQTSDYVMGGRRFERISDEQLEQKWAKAFRQFVKRPVGTHVRDMDDAGAELRLRGSEFPTYLVTPEVEQLRAAIGCISPDASPSAEFVRKFNKFIEDLANPAN